MPNRIPAPHSRWRTRLLAGGASAILAFGAVTLFALEGNDVVSLQTRRPDGTVRTTRVWIASDGKRNLIEAATGERGFLHDILANPQVTVVRYGVTRAYTAAPIPNPEGHRLIRRRLREKYGWADSWIGLLTDTSASLAIELTPG